MIASVYHLCGNRIDLEGAAPSTRAAMGLTCSGCKRTMRGFELRDKLEMEEAAKRNGRTAGAELHAWQLSQPRFRRTMTPHAVLEACRHADRPVEVTKPRPMFVCQDCADLASSYEADLAFDATTEKQADQRVQSVMF